MHRPILMLGVVLLAGHSAGWTIPETVNVQGTLHHPDGEPVAGLRAYRIQFYTAPVEGAPIGASVEGTVELSPLGRFSIDFLPPEEIFQMSEAYYEVGVDSADPSDGVVDAVDLFPERVKVNSVLFSRRAQHALQAESANHAETAAQAETADVADGLSGPLSVDDPIQLGDEVFLQLGVDGALEILVGGRRLRPATQRWTHPRNLQDNITPNGQNALSPEAAISDNGEAFISYTQHDGANFQIFRSHFRKGVWIDPPSLSDSISPKGRTAGVSSIDINRFGDAVLAWQQFDGSGVLQIFRSERRNGVWSGPASLADNISPDTQPARNVDVAVNDSGDAVIVWQQSDGARTQIFRSELVEGEWSDPLDLMDNISPDGADAVSPKVALSNNGEAVIVWQQSVGLDQQIFRVERRGGVWTEVQDLDDNISPDGTIATQPQVVMNDHGEAIVVWRQTDGSTDQIFLSEYRNGVWTDPADLSDNISPDGVDGDEHAETPQVAVDNQGDAVVVWTQYGGEQGGLSTRIYRSERREGEWMHPVDLSDSISPFGSNAMDPDVAMNNLGEALIVWRQSDNQTFQTFLSEYRNGEWKDPQSLDDNISLNGPPISEPRVVMNDVGDAVIVWVQSDGGFDQIFRSHYRFGF